MHKRKTHKIFSGAARLLVFFGLFLLFLPSLPRAEEVSKPYRLCVFFLNEDGKLDKDLQQSCEIELSRVAIGNPHLVCTPPSALLNPGLASKMSPAQREALLAFPELLFYSSFAREILGVDAVLVVNTVKTDDIWLLTASLGEVGSRDWALFSARNNRRDVAIEQMVKEVSKSVFPEGAPPKVLVNLDSRLYHVENCAHISAKARTELENSEKEALFNGYRPCPICFPKFNRLLTQDETEMALSKDVAGAIEYSYRVSKNPEYLERVKRVGSRIVEANHLQDTHYIFNVLDSDEINAFAAPAGPIYATEGLLRILESDDELAAILCHEIAHVENHHAIKQYRQAQQFEFLGVLVGIATRSNVGAVTADFIGTLISRGYDRRYETEADQDALIFAAAAGYRSEELVVTFKKLQDLSKQMPSRAPGWLSTHPEIAKRIQESEKHLGNLKNFEAILLNLQSLDEPLSVYIRTHPSHYLNRLKELTDFTEAYKALRPEKPEAPPKKKAE